MKEIKFRAWIPKLYKICDVGNIDFYNGRIFYIDTNCEEYYSTTPFNKVELMQFTGSKDSNGKEIYEGDILLSTTEYGVFLISIGFGYSEKDNAILGAFKLKVEKQLALSQYFEDFDDNLIKLVNKYNIPIEENNIKCINDGWWIVGNIYENPELLREKSKENYNK